MKIKDFLYSTRFCEDNVNVKLFGVNFKESPEIQQKMARNGSFNNSEDGLIFEINMKTETNIKSGTLKDAKELFKNLNQDEELYYWNEDSKIVLDSMIILKSVIILLPS